MKKVVRAIGLVCAYLFCVIITAALYLGMDSQPHWARLAVLLSGPFVGMLVVNTLRGKLRAMLWMSERGRPGSGQD